MPLLLIKKLLCLLVPGAYALHQDFWNWNKTDPLLFGFLPNTPGELAGAFFSPNGSTLFVNIQTPGVTVAV